MTSRFVVSVIVLATLTIWFALLGISVAAAKQQCRSSISGKMVSVKYAKAHLDTTQCAERK
jgi:hypothetical protein